jgi:hypothetical protein
VCTTSNTAAGVTFTATTTFASLFPSNGSGGYKTPANFVGESGSGGVAAYLAGCSATGKVTDALGYLSPDFTTVDSNSGAELTCANGTKEKSPLIVAGVAIGTTAYLPTVANIELALDHPKLGTNLTPPSTKAEAANPALWVPLIQTVTEGYPIVGYTTFDFAQCYANSSVGTSINSFLGYHYVTTSYITEQNNNGFVSLDQTRTSNFITAIKADITTNSSGFNLNIDNATACAGKKGR